MNERMTGSVEPALWQRWNPVLNDWTVTMAEDVEGYRAKGVRLRALYALDLGTAEARERGAGPVGEAELKAASDAFQREAEQGGWSPLRPGYEPMRRILEAALPQPQADNERLTREQDEAQVARERYRQLAETLVADLHRQLSAAQERLEKVEVAAREAVEHLGDHDARGESRAVAMKLARGTLRAALLGDAQEGGR